MYGNMRIVDVGGKQEFLRADRLDTLCDEFANLIEQNMGTDTAQLFNEIVEDIRCEAEAEYGD